MTYQFRAASPDDIPACITLRGLTRENPATAERLAELGVTVESWSAQVRNQELSGIICMHGAEMAGYCFGDLQSGEIVVLALLPAYEGQGTGRRLLHAVMLQLQHAGHQRLFLGCSPDPAVRSHGFYRRLGWKPSGKTDKLGDEELEYFFESH